MDSRVDFQPVRAWLTTIFGGLTEYAVRGKWREDGLGPVHSERSTVFECLGDSWGGVEDPGGTKTYHARATIAAETLRDLAGQATVLWTVDTVDGGFV